MHERSGQWDGYIAAMTAYGLWGLVPLYWELFHTIPPSHIFSWRVLCSVIFISGLIFPSSRLRHELIKTMTWSSIQWIATGALCIGVNWFIYIWAVNAGHVLETSLGYYLNPLINMLFGVIFFKDRPTHIQRIAITIAFFAVAYQVVSLGRTPWIALSLALTFGLYGAVKKWRPMDSRISLWIETLCMVAPSIILLLVDQDLTKSKIIELKNWQLVALCLSGVVTAFPLLAFARAAKSLSLTVLGFFQYLAPSLQFLCAIFYFKEPLSSNALVVFACIWFALSLVAAEQILRIKRKNRSLLTHKV